MKLWGGRFSGSLNKAAFRFSSSLAFDSELLAADITGSIAHAKMLASVGIITEEECTQLVAGLRSIAEEYNSGKWQPAAEEYEDIHSAVEAYLTIKAGSVAGKLHTGRSRNDQIATDIRLWCKHAINGLSSALTEVQNILLSLSGKHTETIIAGYTHLQRAQPVSLAFHLCAYVEMLERDYQRLRFAFEQTDKSPLGSGALAGSTLPLDRQFTADELGFAGITANALDSVSDRDFISDLLHACSLGMIHLSRLSEELVLWSSAEWGLVTLGDEVTTGSSLMPQKKNPDIAELIRGKSARVLGSDFTLKTLLKGLPLSYNRDLQEDKEPLFDSVHTYLSSLQMTRLMFENIKFNTATGNAQISGGYMQATDIADYLVLKGIPFREAHGIVGAVIKYCEELSFTLEQLTVEELRKFSVCFDEDIKDVLNPDNSLTNKKTAGSPNPAKVMEYITNKQKELEARVIED